MLRCREISKALKSVHPNAQMWPSAQQPHSIPTWGETFIKEMEKLPEEIDGVIIGPNKAFPIDVLRRRLPAKYPIRLYPDITHNVRTIKNVPLSLPEDIKKNSKFHFIGHLQTNKVKYNMGRGWVNTIQMYNRKMR